MSKHHIYVPFTTAQQRKFVFESWEETGNVSEACRKAHVGRTTFYYWKERFDEQAARLVELLEPPSSYHGLYNLMTRQRDLQSLQIQ